MNPDLPPARDTDFDDWLVESFNKSGPFTMLFVLLGLRDTTVDLLRSAYLHVLGDETRWPDMAALFAGARVEWSGAVFFRAGREGLVDDDTAKGRLAALWRGLNEDRSLIRDGDFFNREGLRMRIEERKPH